MNDSSAQVYTKPLFFITLFSILIMSNCSKNSTYLSSEETLTEIKQILDESQLLIKKELNATDFTNLDNQGKLELINSNLQIQNYSHSINTHFSHLSYNDQVLLNNWYLREVELKTLSILTKSKSYENELRSQDKYNAKATPCYDELEVDMLSAVATFTVCTGAGLFAGGWPILGCMLVYAIDTAAARSSFDNCIESTYQ